MKAFLQNGVFRAIYALFVTAVIFGIFTLTIKGHIEDNIKDVALVIIGALIGELKTISGYYYGGMDRSQTLNEKDKNTHI
jgi:hypothetical protein